MPTLLIVSTGGRLTTAGTLDERDELSLVEASAKIAQIRQKHQSCVLMASDAHLVTTCAKVMEQQLDVKRKKCPHLADAPKKGGRPTAIVAIGKAIERYDVTVVVVPRCDLQRMAHAFLDKTVGGGTQLSHGKIVWVDTDHKEHAVL